ncbi:MAG TPA: molybdopterin-dependent oxidoreductase [Dehalococcoidia bacterium]|nr:molybdopterin-dependent oxidoreductase [Dehalococcoidia bacterium]
MVIEAPKTWADRYRDKWKWDKVVWGSHSVDCYPGGCPFRVYVRDGKIVREEQAGTFNVIQEGVPDMNPMGCQKGACWGYIHYSPERVTHPLKRVGERGEGKFVQVSWDEALGDIADAMLDAVQEQGPESIITLMTPEPGAAPSRAFLGTLGSPLTDGNAEFQDWSPGYYITWGKFNPVSSMDDWFLAELTLIWHCNPVYTNIHWFHYTTESRYNGGEVITIAPDYSPSTIHSDYHLPVRIGTDAALALAMCKVVIDEGLYHKRFVQEQTDLALLVRSDDGRFLRGSEYNFGDREDQFFWFDSKSKQIVPAPRGTLALGDTDPALEGTFVARLANGTEVEVQPAFQRLRERLKDYEPDAVAKITEVNADLIRMVARKAAVKRTKIFSGWNSGKYYHGDLMERAMALLLALTGNWGKQGTGTRSWAITGLDGLSFVESKGKPGQEAARDFYKQVLAMRRLLAGDDPTMTPEMIINKAAEMGAGRLGGFGGMMPPAFLWYHQYGYKDRWNRKDWSDPSMKRSFEEYLGEAMEKGWWDSAMAKVWQDVEPRVLFEAGGNVLRRHRGGQVMLLEHLWPKLKCIVSVDFRINTTGLYSDYILPAAQHYEKLGNGMPSCHHLNFVLIDKAVDPPGEAKSDRQIGHALVKKLEERAKARGISEFTNRMGQMVNLEGSYDRITLGGYLADDEVEMDEAIRDTAAYGILPEGTTLETLREQGFARWTGWGMIGHGLAQASTIEPDKTHNPFRWHTEEKLPYPTLTRRAQFYVDHEWFLEAGEELPCHKENPNHGGDRAFRLTSGHPRWSIHSMNMTNDIILNTHRGEPFIFLNPEDAAGRGIENGELVRVVNDAGHLTISVKLSPSVRPGQVILYNGFEPYQHQDWYSQADVEPGMVKWLHMASGYGHLKYRPWHWQPVPVDRGIGVDVEKLPVGQQAK